jgi:NAD(P)H-dependent flavin oxidoreductase YrpB (nitropropane dioxygenase family)
MGVGVSLGNLAGAVAKEGGIGIISTAQIGFKEHDFNYNTFEANMRAMKKEFEKAKKLAPSGIVGFNIMVALNHYKEQVENAVKLGAQVIISGAGLATELPQYVKGFKTKIAPIVSSAKSANVILKLWDKRYSRTADFIVIEGPKAGGHLGFSKDDMEAHEIEKNYDLEIKNIIDVVKQYEDSYGINIPVIVAGGIETKEDMQHAIQLGADGVQVATRFVTTKECDAADEYKQTYINAKKEDIIIVQSPVGMPGRAIKNKFMKKVLNGEKFPPKKCLGCLRKCNPNEIPYCITERLINAAEGNVNEALLFCGANAYKENKITTVKEVINSFMLF